ncbi:hypothetical protein XFF6990_90118 [Xanthomonas citri pv. fuscans]|nr:hypothetical protein XFF6990_90118 [Xanthomonas citri pv. fuscans]
MPPAGSCFNRRRRFTAGNRESGIGNGESQRRRFLLLLLLLLLLCRFPFLHSPAATAPCTAS